MSAKWRAWLEGARWKAWLGKARRAAPLALAALLSFGLGALLFGGPEPAQDGLAGAAAAPAGSAAEGDETVWTCSMHPQIRQPQPGKCPICGMDLIPVESAQADDAASPRRVTLSGRARALARLRTIDVTRRGDPARELRLLGRIEPDETSLKTVTSWIGGRIDRLHVRVTGQRVGAGQAIATLYSPEVLAAHQDLIVAKAQVRRMANAGDAARAAVESALDATRDRLRLIGVPDADLARMESADKPVRQVTIRSPFGGTVIERLATEGAYVTTGAPLYRVADLARVWVQLDAYESDLGALSAGQAVRIEVEAFPEASFEGKVAFIDPTLDPRRRTARVRVEVDNRDGRLRPGMFAQAIVAGRAAEDERSPLVIPDTAPLFTGRRAIVYVEVEDAERLSYEARVVRLGPRMGSLYPVVAGLSEGERVVTRGAFVLDADLQIRGGASMMSGPDDAEPGPWDEARALSSEGREALRPVLRTYFELSQALSDDDLAAAARAAESLLGHLGHAQRLSPEQAQAAWAPLHQALRKHAAHVTHAKDLEGARSGFEALSAAVEALLRRFGNPLEEPVHLAFCSMAFGSRGASWLQLRPEIANAYFGESMRSCGEIKTTLQPGAHLASPARAPRGAQRAPAGGHQH